MCSFTGMQMAAGYMVPVINAIYRDRYLHYNQLKHAFPEKAHLYY